ncbi:MAG: sensor histidine kinase [Candidatus Fonsibacter sp.]
MLRKILPRSLFGRALLIVILPVILAQIVVGTVFYDSIWYKANRNLVRSLIGEINNFFATYPEYQKIKKADELIQIFQSKNQITINLKKNIKELPKNKEPGLEEFYDKLIITEFTKGFAHPFYQNTEIYSPSIQILVSFNNEIIEFIVPKDKIRGTSAFVFLFWIVVPSLLFIFISILFLRNQIRPIIHLSEAAEKFGKGQYDHDFRTSGALEIRKASIEFEKMKRRILKHISQRTAMLSGISHDLKTPLTRMKLELELLGKDSKFQALKEDIVEMEKMISEYLDFASNQYLQPIEKFNLMDLLNNLVSKSFKKNITLKCQKNLIFSGRKNLIRRCIANIINNAQKYGTTVLINAKKSQKNIIITIDDDGPGIKDEQKEKVFRPFYRVDKSRNLNDANVGLGLSIVEDIVNSHGGRVKLLDNPKGKGLRVFLSFPQ